PFSLTIEKTGFWKPLPAFSGYFLCNFLQLFQTPFATFLRLFTHHVGKEDFQGYLFATFYVF
ncbi:MAG: hypothetical protein ACK55I_28375, partial [bacterium]